METLALPVLQADAPYDISFHFDTKTVTLNSGYEMPIYDLGTYSGRNGAYQSATKNTIGIDPMHIKRWWQVDVPPIIWTPE